MRCKTVGELRTFLSMFVDECPISEVEVAYELGLDFRGEVSVAKIAKTVTTTIEEFLKDVGYEEWKDEASAVVAKVSRSVHASGEYSLGTLSFEKLAKAVGEKMK